MGSLRIRLLLGSSLVIILALLASDIVIYSTVRSALYAEFDRSLQEKASVFASLTEFTDEGLETDFDSEDFADFRDVENPSYFQIWRADESVLGRSDSLRNRDLKMTGAKHEAAFASIELPDGRRGRQVSIKYYPKIDDELLGEDLADGEQIPFPLPPEVTNSSNGRIDEAVTIVVAASTAEIDLLVSRLSRLLLAVAAVSVSISLGLVLVVVWKSLLPLKRIGESIEAIDEESLDDRIDAEMVPDEIAPIVNRLNGLLQRVESVLRRERAFSSEVSHELRTPLAGIRSTVEVCLSKPRVSDEYGEALGVCLKICEQSQRMVDSLLAISRLETGNNQRRIDIVDLAELIDECWQEFEEQAASKAAVLESCALEPVSIETDAEKLRVVLRNLLQNAVSHCDDHGKIRLSSTCSNGSVQIGIENTGNKISSHQIDAIFDRFWRGDEARSQTGDHFGLGLSLAKKLVAVLGGQIRIAVSGPLFRAEVSLPVRTNPSKVKSADSPPLSHQGTADRGNGRATASRSS